MKNGASTEKTKPRDPFCHREKLPKTKWTDFNAFGFDLDHTFTRYQLPQQAMLCYQSIAQQPIASLGYSQKLEDIDEDFALNFMRRGLVFDSSTNCLLKLDKNGKISRGCLGTKELSVSELKCKFGDSLQYPSESVDYITKHCSGLTTARFIDNNFYTPSMAIAARMVDQNTCNDDTCRASRDVMSDMIVGAKDSFDQKQFKLDKGLYFPTIKRSPEKFIVPSSDELKSTTKQLKDSGKIVFIVTASYPDYALHVLKNCLKDDWRKYFNFLLCDARKPKFFDCIQDDKTLKNWTTNESSPTEHILTAADTIEDGKIYVEGNVHVLVEALKHGLQSTHEQIKVAYFGDSLSSDIVSSHKDGKLYPVAVIEEIETEIMSEPSDPPSSKKSKCAVSKQFNNMHFAQDGPWGSIWRTDEGEKTLFTHIIETSSLVAIPNVDVICDMIKNDESFDTFDSDETPGCGYLPHPPAALK